MTISVLFIAGSRGSACNNDAYSVVRDDRELLAIIPAHDLKRAGHDTDALRTTFQAVNSQYPGAEARAVAHVARKLLGLRI